MNATIDRNISFPGGRKFRKGERVTVLGVQSLELKWLNETEVTFTVVDGGMQYSMPLGKIVLDEGVELPTSYASA